MVNNIKRVRQLVSKVFHKNTAPSTATTYVVLYRGDTTGRVYSATYDNATAAGIHIQDLQEEQADYYHLVAALAVHHD
ncbi:MAG: hypothetical protein KGI54_08390 [Pseudomonadota bacterium]|nr:hypothetical protein [Pseudomonadota bacterium]